MFLDRHRLSGDHRLIDGAGALRHLTVDRNLVAGADDDSVADHHLLDRQVDLLAVAHHASGLGLQSDQLLDGLRRAPLGLDLEGEAEHDQGDDDRRHVPEYLCQLHAREQSRKRDRHDRIEIGRGDADGDQGVHVGGAMLQAVPHADEEL